MNRDFDAYNYAYISKFSRNEPAFEMKNDRICLYIFLGN